VIRAFNDLELPLFIVGEGPERAALELMAGPTIKFLGHQTSKQVEGLMERCRAFVYGGIEDFGIAPVEAMAAGAPVIGFGRGGLLDTVRCAARGCKSPTGILFNEQTALSLSQAVAWFEESRQWKQFSSESIRAWADRFSTQSFNARFDIALRKAWEEHQISCDVASSDPGDLSTLVEWD
jgi:glycosyltransferase involved in cell wall biosynthesis